MQKKSKTGTEELKGYTSTTMFRKYSGDNYL